MMLHFTKDEETFMRFALELFISLPELSNLKCIGVDLESAIFNGFKAVFRELEGLICVRHINGRDAIKIDKLIAKSTGKKDLKEKAKAEILMDIYGVKNGASYDMGLAEAFDTEDFEGKLRSLEDKWEGLCPGFYSWFQRKRKNSFCSSVIQSAREGTDIAGLFYQNDIESMHHVEKLKQCFKKLSVVEAIASLEKLLKRQDEQEVLAIYGAGSYVLAEPYKTKFGRDSAVWHSWNSERKQQHVDAMRKFKPSISNSFTKPKNCGRKPGQTVRDRKRLTPDVITDRLENVPPPKVVVSTKDPSTVETTTKSPVICTTTANSLTTCTETMDSPAPCATTTNSSTTRTTTTTTVSPITPENGSNIRFVDPRKDPPQVFEAHLRKNLPRSIEKCRGACGVKITPNDQGMLIRTYGTTRWTNKRTGQEESRHGPMYIHFRDDCLKRFNSSTHYGLNEIFEYAKITIDKKEQSGLNEAEKDFLKSLGVRFE